MRTLGVGLIVALTAGSAFAQTTAEHEAALAKLPPLRASIYGKPLAGARELEPAMAGKTDAEEKQIFRAALRPVRLGESFQLTVEQQGTGGAWSAVTSNPQTKYIPNGCLIASASGFVSITKTNSSCTKGDVSELWVAMVENKQTRKWNRYFFIIVE